MIEPEVDPSPHVHRRLRRDTRSNLSTSSTDQLELPHPTQLPELTPDPPPQGLADQSPSIVHSQPQPEVIPQRPSSNIERPGLTNTFNSSQPTVSAIPIKMEDADDDVNGQNVQNSSSGPTINTGGLLSPPLAPVTSTMQSVAPTNASQTRITSFFTSLFTNYPTAPVVPVKKEEESSCLICCTETIGNKVQACRLCNSVFCTECLRNMFERATKDPSMMPPRCCTTIQLHNVNQIMPTDLLSSYRRKFEEWITKDKLYCPKPTCSAFIPMRHFQTTPVINPSMSQLLRHELPQIMALIMQNTLARPFLRETNNLIFSTYPDLQSLQKSLPSFNSLGDFTTALNQIILNKPLAGFVNRMVAMQTFNQIAYKQIEKIKTGHSYGPKVPTMVACVDCSTAVCVACRQIAHPGKNCDHTQSDYETALVTKFRYKQCPKCRTAVRKMFGCNHMACLCGAQWCFGCTKPITVCDGGCSDGFVDDDDDEEWYRNEYSESIISSEGEGEEVDLTATETAAGNAANVNSTRNVTVTAPSGANNVVTTAQTPPDIHEDRDLDAGGYERWREDVRFGLEPSNDGVGAWECTHDCGPIEVNPAVNRTVKATSLLECCRCFKQMKPWNTTADLTADSSKNNDASIKTKGHQNQAGLSTNDHSSLYTSHSNRESSTAKEKACLNMPYECTKCFSIYCGACKSYFKAMIKLGESRNV